MTTETLPEHASRIVAAYVGRNRVDVADVPNLIQVVHAALAGLGTTPTVSTERPTPAVPIKRSVTDEHIVCLDCGHQMQMLKRHLHTTHRLTPDQYRARWGLAPDYPLLARGYSATRSSLAKKHGLGVRGRPEAVAEPPAEPAAPAPTRRRAASTKKTTSRRRAGSGGEPAPAKAAAPTE